MKTINLNEVIAFINSNCAACFAYENNCNIDVTYRGKRNDRITIDFDNETIERTGRISGEVLQQIADFTGFEII